MIKINHRSTSRCGNSTTLDGYAERCQRITKDAQQFTKCAGKRSEVFNFYGVGNNHEVKNKMQTKAGYMQIQIRHRQ